MMPLKDPLFFLHPCELKEAESTERTNLSRLVPDNFTVFLPSFQLSNLLVQDFVLACELKA